MERGLARLPLAKHGFGYVGSEKGSVETEELVYAPIQIHGRTGKGASLTDSPRCALRLGLYYCGLTLAKSTPKGLHFQLRSWLHQPPADSPRAHTSGLGGQTLRCYCLGESLTVTSNS